MRSLLLILGTAGALFGVFFIYTQIAAPPRLPAPQAAPVAAAAPPDVSGQTFAAGAWVNLYDKDGQEYGRLRARICTPQPDNRCLLSDPEAEFYQHDGRIVHLVALDGDVRLGEQGSRSPLNGGSAALPTQGTLRNVTINLYPGEVARQANLPDLTLHMDNTQFDADTYRLFTIAQAGLPADRIPITVRGRDLDFDGFGLMLVWDGQLHELKSLLIAHGNRLRFKSGASENSSADASKNNKPTVAVQQPGAAGAVHVYRATFADDVRIVQADQQRVGAQLMTVLFAQRTESRPARAPADQPAAPGVRPSNKSAATAMQPTDVFWSGPLRIVPDSQDGRSLQAGEAVVAFSGSPVHLHQDNMDMMSREVVYETASGAARVVGAVDDPLRLTMQRDGRTQGTLLAERAEYSPANKQIEFTGAGRGDFADPDKPDESLRVAWAKDCHLALSGSGNRMQVKQVQLQGTAQVRDGPTGGQDRLRLDAAEITANLEPAAVSSNPGKATAPSAQLRRLVAVGDARCAIHDDKEADRTIATDKLTIQTDKDAQGKLYPKTIIAEGNVHGASDQDQIWSRRMDATIAPRGRSSTLGRGEGSFTLQTLTAVGDVRALGRNGDRAAGDLLRVEQSPDGRPAITLLGSPSAMVSGDNGTLRGREIEVNPQEHTAAVIGSGSIDCVRAAQSGKAPEPMHARWEKSALIKGDENLIEINGDVAADTTEANGTTNAAQAQQVILRLVAGPTTRAEKVARPGGLASFDLLQGKQVQSVILRNHAWISSTQPARDGSIRRRTHIDGDDIEADLATQRLVVAGPGRMLLEDHGKLSSRQVAAEPADKIAQGRGETGIRWVKQFAFDQVQGRATIDGPVRIVHWPDAPHGATAEVLADQVIADFDKNTPSRQMPPGQDAEPVLKQLTAQRHVQITTFSDRTMEKPDKIIQAQIVTYDPATQTLTATGGDDGQVQVTDPQSRHSEVFGRVEINLSTNQFKVSDFTGQVR